MNAQFLYFLSWHLFWFANDIPTVYWLEDYMANFKQAKRNLSFFFLLEMEKKSSALKIWHQGSSLFSAEYWEFCAISARSITFRFFMLDLASFTALMEWRRMQELLMSAGLCSACYLPSGNNRKHCWHAVQFYLFFTTHSVSKFHESHLLRLRWEAGWCREWRGGIYMQIFRVRCTSLGCPVWILIPGETSPCCFIYISASWSRRIYIIWKSSEGPEDSFTSALAPAWPLHIQ